MSNNLIASFKKSAGLADDGLDRLRAEKKSIICDVTTEAGFKAARKERTEQNKYIDAIKRAAIDAKTDIDGERKRLIAEVEDIYSVNVLAFEQEDERRKQEKAEQERKEKERKNRILADISNIKNFASGAYEKSSEELQSIIQAVDLIDVGVSFAEFTQEALNAKKETLAALNQALSHVIDREAIAREREELARQREELEQLKRESKPAEEKQSISEVAQSHGASAATRYSQKQDEADEMVSIVVNEVEYLLVCCPKSKASAVYSALMDHLDCDIDVENKKVLIK